MTVINKAKQSKDEDMQEIIDMLKQLTIDEKNQVKGIMIGIQMSREQLATHNSYHE